MYQWSYERINNKFFITATIIIISCLIGLFSSLYSMTFLYLGLSSLFGITLLFLFVTNTELMVKTFSVGLLSSLFLIPSFGDLGMRLEDLIVVFLFIFIVGIMFKNISLIHTPVNKYIFFYISYVLLISIVQITLNNLSVIYILFSIKEIQYLVYFFCFVYVMRYEWFRTNFKTLFLWLSITTMAWVGYQLLFNVNAGFYGVGLLSEPGSSQSGGVFFLISIFFIYMININYKIKQRVIYFILFIGSAGMLFVTMSRTAIMAFAVVYLLYLTFTVFRLSAKRLIISGYLLILSSPLIYFLIKDELISVIGRLNAIDQSTVIRTTKWDYLLSYVSDLGFVFGEGRGFAQTMTGGLTLATDSQYVRNIMELGYIGSALFIIMILSIILFGFQNLKTNYGESLFIILITTGFMVMSITHEVFLVTIQSSFYWTLLGAFMGKILYDKKVNFEQMKTSETQAIQ